MDFMQRVLALLAITVVVAGSQLSVVYAHDPKPPEGFLENYPVADYNRSIEHRPELQWEGGRKPAPGASGCIAYSKAGKLRLSLCNKKLQIVCTHYRPREKMFYAAVTSSVAWFDAWGNCANNFTDGYTLAWKMTAEIYKGAVEHNLWHGGDDMWTHLYLTPSGYLVEDPHNNFARTQWRPVADKKINCAISANMDYITPFPCFTVGLRGEDKPVIRLVCVDTISDLFYVDMRQRVQTIAEAVSGCADLGYEFRIPEPVDFRRTNTDGSVKDKKSYEILASETFAPQDFSQISELHFYINFFRVSTKPSYAYVDEASVNVPTGIYSLWASRDVSDFLLPGYDLRDFPSEQFLYAAEVPAEGPVSEEHECLTLMGPAKCSDEKFMLCRDAQSDTLSVSFVKGAWRDGYGICDSTMRGSAFAVPAVDEMRADLRDDIWINRRHDNESKTVLTELIPDFRHQLLTQGRAYQLQSPRWKLNAANYTMRQNGHLAFDYSDDLSVHEQGNFKRFFDKVFPYYWGRSTPKLTGCTDQPLCKKQKGDKSHLLTVHWFDVGQGQLQVIEPFSHGQPAFIIDAGQHVQDVEDADEVEEWQSEFSDEEHPGARPGSLNSEEHLKEKVRDLLGSVPPIVILSHPDVDHISLLSKILGKPDDADYVQPSQFVYGGRRSGAKGYDSKTGLGIVEIMDDMARGANLSNMRLLGIDTPLTNLGIPSTYSFDAQALAPWTFHKDGFTATVKTVTANNAPRGRPSRDPNENSLTVEVSFGAASVYFMGDAQGNAEDVTGVYATEKTDSALRFNILTASHHGASTKKSNGKVFAQRLKPKIVVYSAGVAKEFSIYNYGHPRCDGVKNYIPSVMPFRDHDFMCFSKNPRQIGADGQLVPGWYWDQSPSFALDGTDYIHVNEYPSGRGYYKEGPRGTAETVEEATSATNLALVTTQESGHIKAVIKVTRNTDGVEETAVMLETKKPRPGAPPATHLYSPISTGEVAQPHTELRKRYSSLIDEGRVQLEKVMTMHDGTIVGIDQQDNLYIWGELEPLAQWLGPIPKVDNYYEIPLNNGEIAKVMGAM